MEIVKCNWSGGKDSSCATDMHLKQGDKCIVVCYIPMFTNEIPLILKEHYDFILRTAERFRKMGADVRFVNGISYCDFVQKRSSRGKFKGRMFGFPPFMTSACNFKRDSKVKSLQKLDNILSYDYEDIGIAFDEVSRHGQLSDKIRSILFEKKITEDEAFTYCKKNDLLSPLYAHSKRDGCVLCPNAKKEERIKWFEQYPDAFDIVLQLQEIVKKERPEQAPLRNHRFFIEEDPQLSFFDSSDTRFIIN